MKFRPEANIFALMNTEELQALAADIDEHGQLETVKILQGDILDGRNRWLAMTKYGRIHKSPRTEEVNPKSPIAFVLSENEQRRHLTTSQRHAAGAEALPFFEAEAKKRQREGQGKGGKTAGRGRAKDSFSADLRETFGSKASADAAKAVGTKPRGVEQANRVKKHGSPKLFDAIKNNIVSTDTAERILKKTSDKTEQERLLKAVCDSKQATRVKCLSGEVEWYTPRRFLDAAMEVMGSIDLDPASSQEAQKHVKATKYYTLEQNGLDKPWWGNVFLNPPYRASVIQQFVRRMVEMYAAHAITQGILLTNNATDTEWFHQAMLPASAICFTKGRIRFIQVINGEAEEKNNPTNGQTFFYFGKREKTFAKVFGEFGTLVRRYA